MWNVKLSAFHFFQKISKVVVVEREGADLGFTSKDVDVNCSPRKKSWTILEKKQCFIKTV